MEAGCGAADDCAVFYEAKNLCKKKNSTWSLLVVHWLLEFVPACHFGLKRFWKDVLPSTNPKTPPSVLVMFQW